MQNAEMSTYKEEALAYLRDVIEKTGKTPTELARLVEVSQTTFTRPLNSAEHKYAIKFPALQRLSVETGVALPDSLVAAQADGRGGTMPAEIRLPIRYEVAASGWIERDDLPQVPFGYRVVQSISRYAGCEQWIERVVSDSMDRLIPVGSLIRVVNAIAISYRPHHEDIVVVERVRYQGAMVERTVKQVALTATGVELWPRSHNPRWQAPIRLDDGPDGPEDLTVQIVGKVLRSWFDYEPSAEEPEAA